MGTRETCQTTAHHPSGAAVIPEVALSSSPAPHLPRPARNHATFPPTTTTTTAILFCSRHAHFHALLPDTRGWNLFSLSSDAAGTRAPVTTSRLSRLLTGEAPAPVGTSNFRAARTSRPARPHTSHPPWKALATSRSRLQARPRQSRRRLSQTSKTRSKTRPRSRNLRPH